MSRGRPGRPAGVKLARELGGPLTALYGGAGKDISRTRLGALNNDLQMTRTTNAVMATNPGFRRERESRRNGGTTWDDGKVSAQQ